MANKINLTIDGQPVSVPEGTLIVNAAKMVGIDIPVFCYHPKMKPAGMCRQCLVEIGRPMIDRASGQPVLENGQPKIQFGPKLETSCTTPVSEGMVVHTQSEKAQAGQKANLEFLLTSHPLDCPICDKGGECPLQNLTMAHGPGQSRFIFDEKHHAAKHVPLSELIYLDRERCIQCARCTRFQDEVVGEPVIGFYQRGRNLEIVSYSDPGFDSVFSGNTTDICPVGALTTADFRFGARPWELKSAASVCSQCPVGCNLTFNTRREAKSDGQVVIKRVMPRQNEQVNETWICDKGRFAGYQFTESPERLLKPQVRKEDGFRFADWDVALKQAAGKLAESKEKLVVLASGRLSNEDLFNLKQLSDQLGGQAVLYTHMGGGDLTAAYGVAPGSNLGELGPGDAILVAASDLQAEAPLWWLRVKQAAERGATLVVVNARETKLDPHASFVVRYAYGDEAETVNGLLQKDKLGQALREANNLVVFYGSDGLGLEGSSALAVACAGLLKDTQHTGNANNGLIGVWPRANEQGAWELGFRPLADLAPSLTGKTVYVAAADPAGDDPALAEALKAANFVIVQDILHNATVELADVVLPAQAYTEREGSFTSGERRVQRFYPATPPRGQARADFAITAGLAQLLNLDLEGRAPVLAFDRLAAAVPAFAGLNYGKLAEVTEQWPLMRREDLFYGGTSYENTQGLGVQLELVALTPVPSPKGRKGPRPKEGELLAVPVTKLYDRGATVAPSQLLAMRIGELTLLLNPAEGARLGLDDGSRIELGLNGAAAEGLVRLDERVPSGVALVPRSMGLPISSPSALTIKVPAAV
jgi:NADH-quinone oxidoreductase subunit G